jgi:hypothetical protein
LAGGETDKKLIGTVHLDIATYAHKLKATEHKQSFEEVFKLDSCPYDEQATLNVTLTFDQPKLHHEQKVHDLHVDPRPDLHMNLGSMRLDIVNKIAAKQYEIDQVRMDGTLQLKIKEAA